jgi:hypothetical protein
MYFMLYFSILNTMGISHLKIRLPTLHLLSLTSKFLTVTMRVVFDLKTVFHAQFVDRFVICLHTKFLKFYCSVALFICSSKLVAKESFVTAATWFYALWRHYLGKLYTFPRSLTTYRFRTLRQVLLLPYSFTF